MVVCSGVSGCFVVGDSGFLVAGTVCGNFGFSFFATFLFWAALSASAFLTFSFRFAFSCAWAALSVSDFGAWVSRKASRVFLCLGASGCFSAAGFGVSCRSICLSCLLAIGGVGCIGAA